MGRTSSKINKKFEDLLSSNTLPRCAASKMKKLRGSFRPKKEENIINLPPLYIDSETLSNSNSIANFSDKICNDSGYFDTLTTMDESLCESSRSSLHMLDESICADELDMSADMLQLRPLYFEVPGDHVIHRRPQVLDTLVRLLEKNRGAVITGSSGSGKTSILLDLVQNSYFGGYTSTDSIHSRVVGYHFMQPQDPLTLDLAHFLHSLAAQLSQHPALRAYRDLLLADSNLASLLTIERLRESPSESLEKAILNPLRRLQREDEIEVDEAIILVDGLDQELNLTNVIADFLAKNVLRFPSWLKLVVTHRSERTKLTNLMSLPYIRLDLEDDSVQSELMEYIEARIFSSETLVANITHSVPRRKNMMIAKFVEFIHNHADGSFLYAKLVLDLITLGYLSIKTESFTFVPRSLAEVFHLYLSFRFPTTASFRVARDIFSVVLASTKPMTLASVSRVLRPTDLVSVREEYTKIADLLVTRSDGSLLFVHPEVAEFLLEDGHRFNVSAVAGHNMFMWFYARKRITRTAEVLELVHHLDKTNLFDQNCEYFSNWDRKYLYLSYKVETGSLKKSVKLSDFNHFFDAGCRSLLTLALGTKA